MRAHHLLPALIVGLSIWYAPAAQAADVIRIVIDKVAFAPVMVSARVGDTVEWVNDDFVAHTATARDKTWDIVIPPHKTGRLTLTRAGTFDYYCRYHPQMTGRLTVAK